MEEFTLLVITTVFSSMIAILGYFVKSVHTEIKALLKELTEYTAELRSLISGIQIQIDKGIEADITEIKADVRNLYRKSNGNTNALSKIQNTNPNKR